MAIFRKQTEYRGPSFFYLDAEGLLGQPAAGGPSVVFWGEGVCDAELLTNSLKGIVAHQPEVFQKLFPSVNGHKHTPLVSFILKLNNIKNVVGLLM